MSTPTECILCAAIVSLGIGDIVCYTVARALGEPTNWLRIWMPLSGFYMLKKRI